MRRIDRLIREARDAATARGHKLAPFARYGSAAHRGASSKCVKCGAFIQVTSSPMPNEIDIGGTAVALGCDDVREQAAVLERHIETGEPLSYDEAHTIYDYGVVGCWWEFENVGGDLYKYVGEREGAD